jgi:hypothetical protein
MLSEDKILSEIMILLDQLEIELKISDDVESGFCQVKNKKYIFLNKINKKSDKIKRLLNILKEINLENVFVKPILRELINEGK